MMTVKLYRFGESGDHSFGEGTVNWNDPSEVPFCDARIAGELLDPLS